MKKNAKAIILIAVFAIAIDVLGMSIKVPSIGAVVVGAGTIVIGTFVVKGEQVLVKVEDCLVGRVPESQEVGVCAPRRQLFFSLPRYVQSLKGGRCIVFGERVGDIVELPCGAYSIWPYGVSSREGLGDFKKCQEVVRLLLKYKGVSESNRTHLVSLLVDDLETESGRVAVTSFLAEDVVVWRDNNSLRKDVGCVVGWALSRSGHYDEAGRQYFLSGMPSVPAAIALRYLHDDYLSARGKSRDLAGNCLRSYLRSHGGGDCAVITRTLIDACAEQWLVSDMSRVIKLLDSDDISIRAFAPLVLSSISGIRPPAKMREEDMKNFWANELEGIKAKSKRHKSKK